MKTEGIFLNRRHFLSAAVLASAFVALRPAINPDLAYAASLDKTYGENKKLQNFPAGGGIIKTYKDAFTGNDVTSATYFVAKDGRLKIAFAVIGLANQFQVIDAVTGKNEFAASPPSRMGGVVSGLSYNSKDKYVYSTSAGTVSQFDHATKTFKDLGQVTPNTTTGYGPVFDTAGNTWFGSFPDAGIGKFAVTTGKNTPYPNVDAGSEYVRSLAILDGTVYCGTGSVSPKIVSFPTSNPKSLKKIAVPGIGPTGFVSQMQAHVGRLFAFYEDAALSGKCSVYNPKTGTWESFKYNPSGRKMFSIPGDPWVYFVAKTYPEARVSIVRWNSTTNVFETVAACPITPNVVHVRKTTTGDIVDVFGNDPTTGVIRSYSVNITSGKVVTNIAAVIAAAPYKVQDFIPSDDGKIYVGGYQGDGIATIDMKTNARWRSDHTNPINQIEGMIEYSNDRIYVGSYGSAHLIRFDKATRVAKRIKSLRPEYMQSRPFAWALAAGKVVCGTVPEYGHRGGALAVIEPSTDNVERVKNKLIPEQSIVGLVGNGDIAYGTTSVKGGYGIPDDTKPATVFAYNVKTDKILWKNTSLTEETEINCPIFVKGRLFVGVANGIIEINPSTGATLRTWKLFSRVNVAGYRNIRIAYHAPTDRLIHCGGGTITAIGLSNDSRSLLFQGTAGTMKMTASGRLFMVTGSSRDISEIDATFAPSISSTADLIAISSTGAISLRRSNGKGGYADPVDIVSSGYADAKSVHIADWNGNGVYDLVSNHKDGSLRVRYGLPKGGFEPFVKISTTGWDKRRITVGRWNYNTRLPAVIAIETTGIMNLWQVSTSFTLGAVKAIGSGWKAQQFAILDRNNDSKPGLIVKNGAAVYWYPNTSNILPTSTKETMATGGLGSATSFTVVQKHKSATTDGIVWHETTNKLRYMSNISGKTGGIIEYGVTWAGYRLGGTSV